MTPTEGRPSFQRPPVREVGLAIQFRSPLRLRVVDLGALWHEFRDGYPGLEEHPRVGPMLLASPALSFGVQLVDAPDLPRLWFLSDDGTQLVQVQGDRLVVNWRRLSGTDEYPRYEHTVRPMLQGAWARLSRALAFLGEEPPEPDICEVIYANAMPMGEGWSSWAEIGQVIAPWSGEMSDEFLAQPADALTLSQRFSLPNEQGWLNIEASTGAVDTTPALLVDLTARGLAAEPTFDGALSFMDLAREWIVRGFTSFTTTEMHAVWGRDQ